MKRICSISIILFLISAYSYSQFTLEIEITGIRNDSGLIMLQLFDKDEKVLLQTMRPVSDKKCQFTVKDLKAGEYAVRYYHDENLNGRMETNIVGKPTEGYGFSNNVTGKFRPPPFKDWLFELKGNKKITMKPVY